MSRAVITSAVLAETLGGALQRAFGHLRNADKLIARAAGGRADRAARRWKNASCVIDAPSLLNLMKQHDEIKTEILRLLENDEG